MGVANYDVVVVGAGAAGLSAAIGLAKRDFSVLVVEAAPFPGAENWSGCVYFCESLADPDLLGPEGVEALAWERRLVQRGIFSSNGHSIAGVTYRDPAAFRHCYIVLRPIFDHHLAQCARAAGATILSDTTAEGLIRERGRVIGVSTQRGPVYADLVFLAEGDASHLITKEGYERESPGRQDPHFLQGVKQVIEMPDGAIEGIFGVGPEEGAAYEILLRNARFRGRETALNMGGFLYTNRNSISLGFVLPLENLHGGFGGNPHMLMEWLRGLPEIRRWTRGGRPSVFGAKLIRGGGVRDVPHLVDHGLAVGGAASAIGVDFPYPNFTGPATGMGLLLARAASAIRNGGGSFTLDELHRHYLEPLRKTHWWNDVSHLRRWPGYVQKTRFFFGRNIDLLQGTLYTLTRPNVSLPARWGQWVRLLRRMLPPGRWGEWLDDTRQLVRALGLAELAGRRPIWRVLLDGAVNALRDLTGRKRPDIHPIGKLEFHFSVGGGTEPVAPLPALVADWARRLQPVLSCAAHEIYRNDPVPVRNKLKTVLTLLVDQINLLDVLAVASVGLAVGATAGCQAVADWLRRLVGRMQTSRDGPRHVAAVPAGISTEYSVLSTQYSELIPQFAEAAGSGPASLNPRSATAAAPLTSQHSPLTPHHSSLATHHSPLSAHHPSLIDLWEDKLGRLKYESIKDSHIKLFWPQSLTDRAAVAEAGIWHICPAKVYECHKDTVGQVRLVVNYENCIKCESCWRASDLVDWARNGSHKLIYPVVTPAVGRLLEALDRAAEQRGRPPKARDWWAPALERVAQRAASSCGNGQFAGELGHLENLCDKIEAKLCELDRSLGGEPRTIDRSRSRWLETLATYAQELVEELVATVRDGPLAKVQDPGLRDVQAALVEASVALKAKMADVARRAYDGHFSWAVADGRQINGHHLEGLRRIVRLLRSHFAPAPLAQDASARWLLAERAHDTAAAIRDEICRTLDHALDPLAWRALDQGTPLDAPQVAAIRTVTRALPLVAARGGREPLRPERPAVLAELGRRDPSLAFVVASHLWARDVLQALGGPACQSLVGRLTTADEMAALAWEGSVEIDRDDEGVRLRGQKIFVPTAVADWFIFVADDQLIALPRATPGLEIEPLGTIGLRGSAPATLVFDNVALPLTRCRVQRAALDRLWAVLTAVDLAATATGMADRLAARAIEHAAGRVQFPGLFLDEDAREAIGKFGAVKKMLAQIGARRYAIETLLYQFGPTDLSDECYRRALELKIVAAESLGGAPGSITYNVTQIFGGTGYSEEDFLPKYYRDGSTFRTLGVPTAEAAAWRGHELLAAASAGIGGLPGLNEASLLDEAVQRKALQRELDTLRRVRHEVAAAVSLWHDRAASDPEAQSVRDWVADGLGRRQAELRATEALLLRTHARLEAGLGAELEVELVRVWLEEVSDAVHGWVDWLNDPDCQSSLPAVQPPALQSKPEVSYRGMLAVPAAYQNGDYLIRPFDPDAPRYVPEMVRLDPELDRYNRELDELFRVHYREKSFDGLSYERHVERQHKLDPEDFELFRKHGFLRMCIPQALGGMGKSKAEYNLLVKNLIQSGDVGMALTVQANCSIGTVPVLLAVNKDLPRAQKETAEFRGQTAERERLATEVAHVCAVARTADIETVHAEFEHLGNSAQRLAGSHAATRVLCHQLLDELSRADAALRALDRGKLVAHLDSARQALAAVTTDEIDAFAEELGRRVEALTQFQQWIAGGQMTAFALTEPSAGSDTARVATRALLHSVGVRSESDGSYRFTPVSGGPERHVIDARRLEFRPDGVWYRWSQQHEPARIVFDEYDYEADDSDRPRYYMAGPVKVPFHDIAQIRQRDGKLAYDYWELNGAKMWLTNARMCGVMVLYAKTPYGVTGFYVDRHAEGLLVGKNEEKMGQQASVTNELGLQAVRVPRENVVGLEGRGQVNALEALNAGRAGLTTSTTSSMDDLIARAERFARERFGEPCQRAGMRQRLEEMAEIRYVCESIAYELVGRADHHDTQSLRLEPSIGKMLASESLLRVIELCEEIYGLEGHTTLHNLEKHRRDGRIITVYEGTNEVQRSLVLKDLVREIAERLRKPALGSPFSGTQYSVLSTQYPARSSPETSSGAARADASTSQPLNVSTSQSRRAGTSTTTGSDKLHSQRETLEAMNREFQRVLCEAVASFGDEIWSNPNMQSVFFGLSEAAAFVKAADSAVGRAEWVLRHFDSTQDGAYRDWTVRMVRRAVARLRHRVRQRVAHVSESLAALRQAAYPPEIRAASLMMRFGARKPVVLAKAGLWPARVAPAAHEVSRAIQIVVIVELEPSVSPTPSLVDGRWAEPHYRLDPADAAALATARAIASTATAAVRVVAIGLGPRRAARILEEALAAGAGEAIIVATDARPMAPEAAARALARAVESHCRAPELILARDISAAAAPGTLGMLVARQLGLEYVAHARSAAVRFTEDESSARVWIGDRTVPRPVDLPAALGIQPGDAAPQFGISDYLASLERPIKWVPWPEEITRRPVRLLPVAVTSSGGAAATSAPRLVSPAQAADVLLNTLGLTHDAAADEAGGGPYPGFISTVGRLPAPDSATVLAVVGSEPSGRLRPGDRRILRVASALARRTNARLASLVFASSEEAVQRRAAGAAARAGASSVTLAVLEEIPEPSRAGKLWSRILLDRWSADWNAFSIIMAGGWAELAFARLRSRNGELVIRATDLAAGPLGLVARTARVENKVDALRELPGGDPGAPGLWITCTDSVECALPLLDEMERPKVEQWPIGLEQLAGRRELLELLGCVRGESGVVRLADAEYIIDVGFGVGSSDGFEEIILPLERLLREIGVTNITLAATRKVTDELKVLPPSRQIGQTGQSVNPLILLAIGVSGAPQHLNYIGPRATILAFNRDPEAPIMTLNGRQPRPRVFPIVGDLFQTVPAFMAALRAAERVGTAEAEPAIAR